MGNAGTRENQQVSDGSHVSKSLTIDLITEENVGAHVDIFVCFTDTNWKSDAFSDTLSSVAGNMYVTSRENVRHNHQSRLQPGDILYCSSGKLNCKKIMLAVVSNGARVESLNSSAIQEASTLLHQVFRSAVNAGARHIAIPLDTDDPFLAPILVPAFYLAYLNHDQESVLKIFHLVTLNSDIYRQTVKTIQELGRINIAQEETRDIPDNEKEPLEKRERDDNDVEKSTCDIQSFSDQEYDEENDTEVYVNTFDTRKQKEECNDISESDKDEKLRSDIGPKSSHFNDVYHRPPISERESAKLTQSFMDDTSHVTDTNEELNTCNIRSQDNVQKRKTHDDNVQSSNSVLGMTAKCNINQSGLGNSSDYLYNESGKDSDEFSTDMLDDISSSDCHVNDLGRHSDVPKHSFSSNEYAPNTPQRVNGHLPTTHGSVNALQIINSDNKNKASQFNQAFVPPAKDKEMLSVPIRSSDLLPLKKEIHSVDDKQISQYVCLDSSSVKSASKDTRSVTFSDKVEEFQDNDGPPLVRSLSNSSDDNPLDFKNVSITRPVKRRQGKRAVERGEPVAIVYTTDDTSAQKASTNFFCVICQSEKEMEVQKKLDICQHMFCKQCIDEYFAREKKVCPVCNMHYGEVLGNMPLGVMSYYTSQQSLPGFEGIGTIIIEYDFPDGIQTEEHPHPGKQYKGTQRSAYIPDTDQGRKCLRMLQKAFDQKITFTIGRSRTSGKEDVVTWNDIHHKTNINGGTERFGYPDPGYLDRLESELRSRGLTDE